MQEALPQPAAKMTRDSESSMGEHHTHFICILDKGRTKVEDSILWKEFAPH